MFVVYFLYVFSLTHAASVSPLSHIKAHSRQSSSTSCVRVGKHIDVGVDELGRCWPRWLTICNLASYGHGIMVSSRQFPVISTRGISMAMGCSTKKSCVRFQVGKRTRLQDSISFGGIFWWKDDLPRWLTGMVEWFLELILVQPISCGSRIFMFAFQCNDSLRSCSLQTEYVPTHFSSFVNQWLYHHVWPFVFVPLPEWFVIFCFFDLVKQLEFVSMTFSWIALRRSPFKPDIIYSGHDGANGMGRLKGTNAPVNGIDGGESQVPNKSNHCSHTP